MLSMSKMSKIDQIHLRGCNAMHVEDVEDGKRTYRHIFIITFLIWYHLNVMLSMSKMSKID